VDINNRRIQEQSDDDYDEDEVSPNDVRRRVNQQRFHSNNDDDHNLDSSEFSNLDSFT